MHRTTTTAALLVTVAVSALSGCMTVQRPAAPGPPPGTAPSQQTAPRPDGSTQSHPVQAPAREGLEKVGPSRAPRHSEPAAPPAAHRPPLPPAAPRPRPDRPRRPYTDVPDLPRSVPNASDVCALGRKYGGWRRNSPEARICERAYGH
ncbi:hypothetical protein QQY24_26315 [Streptomyces sp. TG1A-8]|uniref:hypothetical protein n=1 Tax=Streptomyces sp. TG1A-8 TaxID=3051385 RepID=UPI00265C2642|nr:hypothetical protein [Streptomyces sp. TG1A-8]MDO0928757.1 hypothetical protein [Streptomyces sp. TG1A-8]